MIRQLIWALALVVCLPVHAGVVYNWQTLTGPELLTGRLEFTQEAWRSGVLNYEYDGYTPTLPGFQGSVNDRDSPVLELTFWYINAADFCPAYRCGFDNRFRDGDTGSEDYAFTGVTVSFLPVLTGSFYSGGNDAELAMRSIGDGLWEVDSFYGGYFWIAGGSEPRTVTGRWVLDASTIVPAPGTLALTGLALAFLPCVRRRAVRTTS
jgi:hypothetical protein